MGDRVFASHATKNIIAKAIQNGEIAGDLATRWLQQKEDIDEIEHWKSKAMNGDGEAAFWLGVCYNAGEKGLIKSETEARQWWKIAADCGNAVGRSGSWCEMFTLVASS